MVGTLLQILNALSFAALLFVVASGFTLIFGLLRVVNLAHGAINRPLNKAAQRPPFFRGRQFSGEPHFRIEPNLNIFRSGEFSAPAPAFFLCHCAVP